MLRTMPLCLPFIRFSFPPENLKSHRNSYKINAHYSLMWAVGELTVLWWDQTMDETFSWHKGTAEIWSSSQCKGGESSTEDNGAGSQKMGFVCSVSPFSRSSWSPFTARAVQSTFGIYSEQIRIYYWIYYWTNKQFTASLAAWGVPLALPESHISLAWVCQSSVRAIQAGLWPPWALQGLFCAAVLQSWSHPCLKQRCQPVPTVLGHPVPQEMLSFHL